MTAGAQRVLGNDRVCSETVGLRTEHVQLGHEQRVAAHLYTDHTPVSRHVDALTNKCQIPLRYPAR